MRDIQGTGLYADIIEAPSAVDPTANVKLGVRAETFRQYRARGLATAIAQYYGIVQDGMACTRHLFVGLNRPLMLAEDMEADRSVMVYTWRSPVDFEWHGSQFDGYLVHMVPLPGRVFAVLVRQEEPNDYGMFGSIVKWNWIKEDPKLPGAPMAWDQRYSKKLWSR
jgi:hypothetical protein